MKLKKYLTEWSKDYQDGEGLLSFAEDVKEACYTYLKEIRKCGGHLHLYRGMKNEDFYGIKPIRTDRKPLDMLVANQIGLDKAFYKKYKWKARSNSLFCSGSKHIAQGYGGAYIIFPEGPFFRYLWSPEIDDLYEYMKESGIFDYDDIVGMYQSTDLCRALKTNHEIMVHADRYYYVSASYLTQHTSEQIESQFYKILGLSEI
jgi:hypothetical protein